MTLKLLTGNEALALGALRAGVKVATGYPGTPSTGCIESLLLLDSADLRSKGVHVEWSTNEKVAFEIASGAAWAGQRALCTMKMSGVNVAYDSITSIAYSGVVGGMVIYVADDPGVSAGMCEQDSRGFAVMSDLPMLDAASVEDAYRLVQAGFEISERVGTPVFVRLVTSISSSFAPVDVDEDYLPAETRPAQLIRDIDRFTKAGSLICMAQHRDVIKRLGLAGDIAREMGLNKLSLAGKPGGVGILAAGVVAAYLDEGFEIAAQHGFDRDAVSLLTLTAVHPFPALEARELLAHCQTVLVLEELEPIVERSLYVEAQRMGWQGRILGKEAGGGDRALYERVGEYGLRHIFAGMNAALPELALPAGLAQGRQGADQLAAARPITVCAGCPHRGVFMGINAAVRKAGYKKDEVMVTGDIGCTILGMNPPFNTVWNEVSMGASIPLAQGYVHAGAQTPVIATIGDSTFFHAGIAGLVNAVQHQTPILTIILDNGWTSMTGMQPNPGTRRGPAARQRAHGGHRQDRRGDGRRLLRRGRSLRPGPDDRGHPEHAEAARGAGDPRPAGVRHARPATRRERGPGPRHRRELQRVQAVHHPDRLPCNQPGRRDGPDRSGRVLRLRPVRRCLQPGCHRVHGCPRQPGGGSMNELYDIYLVGVGGQGVLTIGEIIAETAFRAGMPVNFYPTKGMAQRGGFVKAQLRLGRSTPGPAIPEGGADLVIATEVSEALKAVKFVKKGGDFVLFAYVWAPTAVMLGKGTYPALDAVLEQARRSGRAPVVIDPERLPLFEGQPVPDNVYTLGVAATQTSLGRIVAPDAMADVIGARWKRGAERNLFAFRSATAVPGMTSAHAPWAAGAAAGSLEPLFSPRAVALVGSVGEGKLGYELLRQMLAGGYRDVVAVNPKGQGALGAPGYASIAASGLAGRHGSDRVAAEHGRRACSRSAVRRASGPR